ncbi:THAP domain-containing protein 1-like [Aricia agestis]|uniref:THAP domain-containing protein 1-like n=1 Tax=Aricia agestis TaxID=91739 RepID=UPI001C204D31|nr:THAP domain-containing protein 1-like [Aricia agestis]
MPLCTVPGCNNNGVHLFPKNPGLKKQWEIAIRRKNFVATKHSRICRDHFKESDYVGESAYTGYQQQHRFLKQGIVPSVFPWTKLTTPTSRALRYEQRLRKRRLDYSVAQESTSESSCQVPPSANEVEIATSSQPDDTVSSNKHEASTQTAHSCGILSLNAISNDNNIIHFYTGMETYDKFMLLFDTLCPMCYDLTYRESRVMNVSPQEQLLITMIKLRRNLPDVELAFLFGISSVNTVMEAL